LECNLIKLPCKILRTQLLKDGKILKKEPVIFLTKLLIR